MNVRRRWIVCGGWLFVLLGASTARAATITVDTTAQATATSTPDGHCSLGEAIDAANRDVAVDGCAKGDIGVDTIALPAGTYALSAGWLGAADSNALPKITEDVTIVGADAKTTTISIDPTVALAFFEDNGGELDAQHLTFSGSGTTAMMLRWNTSFTDVVFTLHAGPGTQAFMHAWGSTVTFDHVTFTDNDAELVTTEGGATLNFTHSTVSSNRTTLELISLWDGALNVTDSTFDKNLTGRDIVTVTNSGAGSTTTTLTRSTFTGNVANGGDSVGVLQLNGHGALNVDGCTFDGNRGARTGGFALETAYDVSVVRSTFHANSGYRGGAIDVFGCAGPTVTIRDTTFSGNSATAADGRGGAIFSDATASVLLDDVTLADNHASKQGGAISYDANGGSGAMPFSLSNTIVAGNVVDAAPSIGVDLRSAGTLTFTSNGYNLVGDGTDAVLSAASGDQLGTKAAPIDAKLAPYGDYGGATKAQPPYVSSPAVGKGSPTVGDTVGACDSTDQEGATRTAGGCTVGAVQTTVPDPTPDAGPDVAVDANDANVDSGAADTNADTNVADAAKPDTTVVPDAIAEVSNEAGPPIAEKVNDSGCGCRVVVGDASCGDPRFVLAALGVTLLVARRRRKT